MIIDHIDNLMLYKELHPKFQEAFLFILNNDISKLLLGKHEINKSEIFIIIDKSKGRSKKDSHPELHRKYIDIQIVLNGIDEMGWLPKSYCTKPIDKYSEENDIQFFENKPISWIKVKKKMFVIFFPDDAHQPLIGNSEIYKAVVKVAI